MTAHYLSKVAEFHRAFRYRQPEPIAPDVSDRDTNTLRCSLLREELHELKDAKARVDELDALCDTQYVLSGAVLAWGYRSLFENTRHVIELRKVRDMEKHIAAMLGIVAQMEAIAEMNFQAQMLTLLIELQSKLQSAIWSYGFTQVFVAAFDEVHANNMDKFFTASERSVHPELTYEPTSMGIIGRRADGKIQKPPHHAKVDLSRFV